ncbi:uncharacterized protein LOC120165132 isoform X2 [Hibiscus syriacus]|uniref:uncharacterized protein LOC120165132 isoform X2 n=1 Tax=Hibiscus syriacus TaxID=106335 RepID=UPI0019237B48|nr:uncharacterized protein LOC120165132 isoform X2 [Hibiscus syriacus]
MGIIGEEPVLSRLDRLDNLLRQLEEMRGSNNNGQYLRSSSPRSSSASTPSSGTLASTCTDGHPSSVDFSPTAKSLEKYCRPMDVMVETQVKGTLIQRLDQAEDRLLKLEEELEEKRQAANVEKGQKKGIKHFETMRHWETLATQTCRMESRQRWFKNKVKKQCIYHA